MGPLIGLSPSRRILWIGPVAALAVIALALPSSAQAPDPPDRLRPSTDARFKATGSFFALSIPDMQASAKWCSEKLGLGGGLIVEPS